MCSLYQFFSYEEHLVRGFQICCITIFTVLKEMEVEYIADMRMAAWTGQFLSSVNNYMYGHPIIKPTLYDILPPWGNLFCYTAFGMGLKCSIYYPL